MSGIFRLPAAVVLLTLATSATAAPREPNHGSIAENIAFSNSVCADPRAETQVAADFIEAVHLHLAALAPSITPSTKIVVPEAHTISIQGYPNGFILENGHIKSVVCQANLATRINGRIVEYRGIFYRVTSNTPAAPLIQTVDPATAANFINHLFIDNQSLTPDNGRDFGSALIEKERERQAMVQAGFISSIDSPTPEVIVQWRTLQLQQLLGALPTQGGGGR